MILQTKTAIKFRTQASPEIEITDILKLKVQTTTETKDSEYIRLEGKYYYDLDGEEIYVNKVDFYIHGEELQGMYDATNAAVEGMTIGAETREVRKYTAAMPLFADKYSIELSNLEIV